MSDSVEYIFAQSSFVEGIGEVYPIQMKYYNAFMNAANIICLSYNHFNVEEIKKTYNLDDVKLLDLIILMAFQSEQDKRAFFNLTKIFSLILKKDVSYSISHESFITDDGLIRINRDNYDELRTVIMKQNLLFTPRVYKTKKLQEWAEKVIKARAKNGIDSNIEAMVSTVAVKSGKHYWDLELYTIYQIRQEYNRIIKIVASEQAYQARLAGNNNEVDHFAETIDMFKDPYADIFKEKSSFTNIGSAVQGDK